MCSNLEFNNVFLSHVGSNWLVTIHQVTLHLIQFAPCELELIGNFLEFWTYFITFSEATIDTNERKTLFQLIEEVY